MGDDLVGRAGLGQDEGFLLRLAHHADAVVDPHPFRRHRRPAGGGNEGRGGPPDRDREQHFAFPFRRLQQVGDPDLEGAFLDPGQHLGKAGLFQRARPPHALAQQAGQLNVEAAAQPAVGVGFDERVGGGGDADDHVLGAGRKHGQRGKQGQKQQGMHARSVPERPADRKDQLAVAVNEIFSIRESGSMPAQPIGLFHYRPPHGPGDAGQHQGAQKAQEHLGGPAALAVQQNVVGTGIALGERTVAVLHPFDHRRRAMVASGVGVDRPAGSSPPQRQAQHRKPSTFPSDVQAAAQSFQRVGVISVHVLAFCRRVEVLSAHYAPDDLDRNRHIALNAHPVFTVGLEPGSCRAPANYGGITMKGIKACRRCCNY